VKVNKKIDANKIPTHVAFIMDGNGRWAQKRGLPRKAGHARGYSKMKTVIKRCSQLKVKVCSIYAFSTENWNRPKDEIDEIFKLIRENMHADTPFFNENNVKVVTMGDITRFPQDLQDKLGEIMQSTKHNDGTILNLCINYGGKADIVHAVNKFIINSPLTEQLITEQDLEKNLYGADLPPPDLIVRTSGEQRVSNFMLWQMAYSEFFFIKPHWPAMTARLVDKCIIDYQKRNRRFGNV